MAGLFGNLFNPGGGVLGGYYPLEADPQGGWNSIGGGADQADYRRAAVEAAARNRFHRSRGTFDLSLLDPNDPSLATAGGPGSPPLATTAPASSPMSWLWGAQAGGMPSGMPTGGGSAGGAGGLPALPPPMDIAMRPAFSAPDIAPQVDSAVLPPNSSPTMGATFPGAPAATNAPQPARDPGFGDRLGAGFGGLANGHTLLGGIGNLIGGLATGHRQDQPGMTEEALVAAGVSPVMARAAGANPALIGLLAPKLQETGTDPFTGQKTFATFSPTTGALTPLTMGGAQSGGGTTSPSLTGFRQAIQSGVTGDGLYEYLPAEMRNSVKQMIDGRMAPPTGAALRSDRVMAMTNVANAIDPSFDATTWASRYNGVKDFYGGGKSSETVRKTNQSALHFGELVDKMQALPGHSIPLLNAGQNFINSELLGKGEAGNFIVNAHALADELSSMFKGAGISDAEIRAWESKLSPSMSDEQQRGMAKTLLGLYRDSVSALDKKRTESLGPTLAGQRGPILGPEAEQALARVEKFTGGQNTQASPASAATPVPREGATATNPQTKQRIIFKGGQWQPI